MRRGNSIPVLWTVAGICAVLTLIAVFIWVAYQPSTAVEFACGLGDQNSCDQIIHINSTRFLAGFFAFLFGIACVAFSITAALVMSNAARASTYIPPQQYPGYPPQYPPLNPTQMHYPQYPAQPPQQQYPTYSSQPLYPPTTQP